MTTVTFSENIAVTGTPFLDLSINDVRRGVWYTRTDNATMYFSYPVVCGDTDTDGIGIFANAVSAIPGR